MSKHQSWLKTYIAKTSGPWKAAMCFFFVVMFLMALSAAAILAGWHNASNRLAAYMALAGVGFFVSLFFHAYLSLRGNRRMKLGQRQRSEETRH